MQKRLSLGKICARPGDFHQQKTWFCVAWDKLPRRRAKFRAGPWVRLGSGGMVPPSACSLWSLPCWLPNQARCALLLTPPIQALDGFMAPLMRPPPNLEGSSLLPPRSQLWPETLTPPSTYKIWPGFRGARGSIWWCARLYLTKSGRWVGIGPAPIVVVGFGFLGYR